LPDKGNSGAAGALPKVWVLASPHQGDNTQLNALAGALGWPCEVKRLSYRRREGLLRLLSLPTLAGVDLARSSPLSSPWPDLVLCSGRGAEAVSFWLGKQNPKLRVVFVGTPWSDCRRFDLVIATPQYRLPQAPNVLHLSLPLHDVTPERLEAEARRWQARLAHLPRPLTALLVGGSSGPYIFTPEAAARLGRQAAARAAGRGGALLVTTSARTGSEATAALEASLVGPHFFHRWQAGAEDNPFHAFLALADEIIVTADSVSMLSEAVSTGKPVWLFDIEEGRFAMRAEEGQGGGLPPIGWRGRTLDATLFRLLVNHAPPRFARDLRVVHRQLLESGRVRWLGEGEAVKPAAPAEAGLARAAARVRGLFGL
jgi:mitochondrial fission protein ELM1